MKKAFFSIADNKNLEYFTKMKNSLKKFHPDIPLILIGQDEIDKYLKEDKLFFYKASPIIADKLFKEGYDVVCKLDCDQIITSNLDHIWEDNYDVAVVQNANPKETKLYEVKIWDINPMEYINCGFVVIKSKEFNNHWLKLVNSDHFDGHYYKMGEQDFLNILVFFGTYKIRFLDFSPKWHGLISKGYWDKIELVDNKLILKKNNEWPNNEDKEIVCIHFAGGNVKNKFDHLQRFKPEVSKYLNTLIT